jgi:hypothetical protein
LVSFSPEGIKPGKNKLKAIKEAKPPTDMKTICSFNRQCSFFCTLIKDFALIAASPIRLTRNDSVYKSGPLPKAGLNAFHILQETINFRTGHVFYKFRQAVCINHSCTNGISEPPGGLGAILTQVDKDRKFYSIFFVSCQLKNHEQNYSPFLLEAAAAIWGMDNFN